MTSLWHHHGNLASWHAFRDPKMAGNVRWWCLSLFLLLFAAAGLFGADLPAEDLVNNEENNITALFPCAVEGVFDDLCEYPSGLAWIHHATTATGNATLISSTFAVSVVGTPCHGSLAMLYDMANSYILQYPRLLDTLAVAIMCFYLFALSAGASTIARRKRPRNIQQRKLLAKRQRLRLMAIRFATTATGTEDWRKLSAKIATLSEAISLLRKDRSLGKSRGRRRRALARLSLQRQAADTASGGLFSDILAMFSLASRRPSPRRQSKDVDDGIVDWVLLGGCLGLLCVVDCVGLLLLRYQQFIWNGLGIISVWYLPDVLWTLQEWMIYFRSQARRRVRLNSEHNLRDELQSRPAAVASVTVQAPATATAEATRHNDAIVAAATARAESEEPSDTIAVFSPTMGIQTAVPAETAAELQLARRQASVADTTTTTSADAAASPELSLAPHRAKRSTSTATAAWLGCNATMRDCSDALTTAAQLRAELAEQASAAAAAAAAAAIVASSKIAAAKEEASIANSRARAAEQGCITVRRERDKERADNAYLRAELRKRDSAAITAAEELVTARKQVVCATSAANKDAEGRVLAEIGRAGAADAAAKLRASLEQKTKVATAATEKLAAARKEVDRLSFGANEGTAGFLTLEHERNTAVLESIALWEKVATQTAATATAKRESETSRQKADRSALAADACAERCHVVELQLADALAESAALRIALAATRTAATDTATENSETPREKKADHQALAADAYAERYHVVKFERDEALAQSAALRKRLETQTAATATATKKCETAWKENARAAFASKEIALERDMSARAKETAGARILVLLRAMLEEQTAATATASRALKASQKQVSRAAMLHTVKFSKLGEPRIRKSTVARLRVKHRQAADAAENKLTVALNNGSRAVEEAVKVTLERDKIKATLVKVQAALHHTQKKLGIRATTREDLLVERTGMQPTICAALLFLSVLLVSGQRRNYYA